VSALLHGLERVQLNKLCVKSDGEIVQINTQMQVTTCVCFRDHAHSPAPHPEP
jgi:hypothetical protein